jgi:deazaflavin-dependent oxidoreductase (nitroreductase family)
MSPRTRLWRFRHLATKFVNPITRRFAGWRPGFGVLTYHGRKTGRTYHTPINVFPRDDEYVFVLTYGSDAEWVKNVMASGRCEIQTRGRHVELRDPKLVVDPKRELAPAPVRLIGGIGGVTEFLTMRAA